MDCGKQIYYGHPNTHKRLEGSAGQAVSLETVTLRVGTFFGPQPICHQQVSLQQFGLQRAFLALYLNLLLLTRSMNNNENKLLIEDTGTDSLNGTVHPLSLE